MSDFGEGCSVIRLSGRRQGEHGQLETQIEEKRREKRAAEENDRNVSIYCSVSEIDMGIIDNQSDEEGEKWKKEY